MYSKSIIFKTTTKTKNKKQKKEKQTNKNNNKTKKQTNKKLVSKWIRHISEPKVRNVKAWATAVSMS